MPSPIGGAAIQTGATDGDVATAILGSTEANGFVVNDAYRLLFNRMCESSAEPTAPTDRRGRQRQWQWQWPRRQDSCSNRHPLQLARVYHHRFRQRVLIDGGPGTPAVLRRSLLCDPYQFFSNGGDGAAVLAAEAVGAATVAVEAEAGAVAVEAEEEEAVVEVEVAEAAAAAVVEADAVVEVAAAAGGGDVEGAVAAVGEAAVVEVAEAVAAAVVEAAVVEVGEAANAAASGS